MTPLQWRALRNGVIATVVVAAIGSVAVATRGRIGVEGKIPPSTPPPTSPSPPCTPTFATVPTTDAVGALNAVSAISPSHAWAVGGTSGAGGTTGPTGPTGSTGAAPAPTTALYELFDANTWGTVDGPSPGSAVNELLGVDAVSSTDVWAVGRTGDGSTEGPLIVHFDGTVWTAELPPADAAVGRLYAVSALGRNDVWAVGSIGDPALGTERALVLHFDGTSWSSVSVRPGGGQSRFLAVSALAPDDVWAVGSHHLGPLILHFDGTTWTKAEVEAKGPLTAVLALAPDDVWAAGSMILHFAGDTWVRRGHVRKGAELAGLGAGSPEDVWAVGSRTLAKGGSTAFALRWDGGRWSAVQIPPIPGREALRAVAVPQGAAVAVGSRGTKAGTRTYAVRAEPCA